MPVSGHRCKSGDAARLHEVTDLSELASISSPVVNGDGRVAFVRPWHHVLILEIDKRVEASQRVAPHFPAGSGGGELIQEPGLLLFSKHGLGGTVLPPIGDVFAVEMDRVG